ncbi:hypothetical protein ACF07D_07565 [Leucobacter sp. NPDC015123]|uniref:hypothetical protein n=1 Tax=Leucobacter sp. NPDC015123 TaxID=3364129 RepID=UPI0036F4AAC1
MTKKQETEKPSVTLPLMEAIEACAAVLPHASKDDVTPVITTANLEGDRIVATDRYTVGAFTLSQKASGPIMVPRQALDWIARTNPRTLVGHFAGMRPEAYQVRITGLTPGVSGPDLLEEAVMVEILLEGKPERMQQFRPVTGTFPPIAERLLDVHEMATEVVPVNLGPEFIERVTGYAKKWRRGVPIRFTAGKSDNPNKPGVVRVSIGKFNGLIQPNLLVR